MASELVYVTCLFAIKISILSLYYRLFHSYSRKFTIAVFVTTSITVVGWLTAFLIFVFQCVPVAYAFDKSLDGHCLDFKQLFIATSTIDICIDVVLLVLPLPVVWHLRLLNWQKLAISGMFLLGGS